MAHAPVRAAGRPCSKPYATASLVTEYTVGRRATGVAPGGVALAELSPRPRSAGPHQVRRGLGVMLATIGSSIIILTILAATGVVPIWRPSLPRPPALSEPAAMRPPSSPYPAPSAGRGLTPPIAGIREFTPRALTAPGPAPGSLDQLPTTVSGATAVPAPSAEPTEWVLPQLPPAPDSPDSSEDEPPAALTIPSTSALTRELPVALTAVPVLTPHPPPSATPRPTPVPTSVPPLPPPALPVHLIIPRIRVDTPVVELSTARDADGVLQWETIPFVAGHYGITGLAGARANVVLSGHVVTREMGNVFRDLHLVRPGDPLVVYTAQGQFTYRVVALRLVAPDDLSVLAPSIEPRLTLLTCAGEFDFRAQTFTERLAVVGHLVTRNP